MLLEKITNRLKGQVRIRVTSPFPERVLNLCGERKLAFWDVVWKSQSEFTCTMTQQDLASLRHAAGKLDCTILTERQTGVPFFFGRLRRRHVLFAGVCICAVALLVGSFFIWDFKITGNTTVTDEEILRSLEKNGVHLGTFGLSVDGVDLRNHVLLDIPKLSWIAVNVSGCQAHVQVRERTEKPKLADKKVPCNIVARRDGLVLKMEALDGEKLALPGTTVQKGQILISGVEDTGTFGARLTAGMGKVYARTWYTLSANFPLQVEQKVYGEQEHSRLSLIFGTKRVKFYRNGSYSGSNYDKIMKRTPLRPFGLATPLTVEREIDYPYTMQKTEMTCADAQKHGRTILTAYLHTLLNKEGSVRSTLCTSHRSGNTLTVTLKAECTEQIGVKKPVLTDDNAAGTSANTKERSQVGTTN